MKVQSRITTLQSRQISHVFNIFSQCFFFFFEVSKYIYFTTTTHREIYYYQYAHSTLQSQMQACCKNFIPLLGCPPTKEYRDSFVCLGPSSKFASKIVTVVTVSHHNPGPFFNFLNFKIFLCWRQIRCVKHIFNIFGKCPVR